MGICVHVPVIGVQSAGADPGLTNSKSNPITEIPVTLALGGVGVHALVADTETEAPVVLAGN